MVRLREQVLTAVGLAVTAVIAASGASSNETLIFECPEQQRVPTIRQLVEEKGGKIRHLFDSDLFPGLSAQLPRDEAAKLLQEYPSIHGCRFWQTEYMFSHGEDDTQPELARSDPTELPRSEPVAGKKRGPVMDRRLGARAEVDSPWTHIMTHLDRLHQKGVTGNGIQIAIVDTGVR